MLSENVKQRCEMGLENMCIRAWWHLEFDILQENASHTWSERLFIIHRPSVSRLAELMFVGNLFELSVFDETQKALPSHYNIYPRCKCYFREFVTSKQLKQLPVS